MIENLIVGLFLIGCGFLMGDMYRHYRTEQIMKRQQAKKYFR